MSTDQTTLRAALGADAAAFESALTDLRGGIASLAADLGSPGATPAALTDPRSASASGVIINGPITITGVQDVETLYDQLAAEGKRRNR